MGKYEKLLIKILTGNADNNYPFKQLCSLMNKLDFSERIKGSHHIFYMSNIDEIVICNQKATMRNLIK